MATNSTTQPPSNSTPYAIRVRLPDMKRAGLLDPRGALVNRRVHAAMIHDREKAERIADEIRTNHPGAVVTVRPL